MVRYHDWKEIQEEKEYKEDLRKWSNRQGKKEIQVQRS